MMKISTRFMVAAAACALTVSASAATPKMAMLVASTNTASLNSQEKTAAKFFTDTYADGDLVSVADAATLTADKYAAVWVHIDRCGIDAGADNLPDGFASAATVSALKTYLADGGCIYLSKHATQLTTALGRIPATYAPGIFSSGDGGNGTDIWTIQGTIGVMNDRANFPNPEPDRVFDASQVYNHTGHDIYTNLETIPAGHQYADFVTATYPMEGTGDGSEMWREDHNCMWDLNTFTYTSTGKNTTEQFEKDLNCTVLGTWGHVQDYCVAGIVEFHPENNGGVMIANGLATCEWAPRSGVNAYHRNLEKLTANTLNYLASKSAAAGIESIEMEAAGAEAAAEYFNLNGVRINPDNAVAGVYIMKQGAKVSKVVLK